MTIAYRLSGTPRPISRLVYSRRKKFLNQSVRVYTGETKRWFDDALYKQLQIFNFNMRQYKENYIFYLKKNMIVPNLV